MSPMESCTLSLLGRDPLQWPFWRVMHGAARLEALTHATATLGGQYGERCHGQVVHVCTAGWLCLHHRVVGRWLRPLIRDWNPRGKEVAELVAAALWTASHSHLLSLAGAVVRVARVAVGTEKAFVTIQTLCMRLLTTPHFTTEEIGSEGLEGSVGLAAVHSELQRASIFVNTGSPVSEDAEMHFRCGSILIGC